jgi:hypothetical protein
VIGEELALLQEELAEPMTALREHQRAGLSAFQVNPSILETNL